MKFLVCGGYGFIGSEFIRNHFEYNPNDEIIEDETQLNEGDDEVKILDENELNEAKNDSSLTPKNDGYTDISDVNNLKN